MECSHTEGAAVTTLKPMDENSSITPQQCKQHNLSGNSGSGRNIHLQQCGKYSEGSHIIEKVEGRQRKTGTDEKGLESTGRASNEYFAKKYKDDDTPVSIQSDGKDYSNVDFGKYMGDSLEDICFISITQCIVRYAGKKMGEETAKKVIKYINQKTKTIEKDMKNIKNNTKKYEDIIKNRRKIKVLEAMELNEFNTECRDFFGK